MDLLGDLDEFSRMLDAEQEAAQRAAEEEDRAKKAEFERQAAQTTQRPAFDSTTGGAGAVAGGDAAQPARSSALDLLRRQASTAQPAAGRSESPARIDQALRSTMKYLSEFAGGVNAASPSTERGYELVYLAKAPPMQLTEAFTDSRNRKLRGDEVCDHVILKFRARYTQPAVAELAATDLELCRRLLDGARVPFEFQVTKKNDFGQPLRGAFNLNAPIPCELIIRGDYEGSAIVIEMMNAGKLGTAHHRISPDQVTDQLIDEIGKYLLGAPNEFAKLVATR